ncbi:hypothetical protein RE628_13865 [Paenibacillus sp. D2_2]|uniref:hypothetical protein n=1 Tax=Paenibacillus sp. D2_2 TaxID=3073092 RepID=UPI002814B777|nr:hypothetical protein [Paenibacillus sp. D2_2]WMT43233.1 hypothetical protein RE628_13865 [Paenibacillus sp. D2_2]
MDRGFAPGGGFGGGFGRRPFFRPIPHPFFPGRALFPFFFFPHSPFPSLEKKTRITCYSRSIKPRLENR